MKSIGIIGAGSMGAGIAQVAAMAGHEVVLTDSSVTAITKARDGINAQLQNLATKGKITDITAKEIFGRMYFAEALTALSDCGMVVEAIIEDASIKRKVFREVEDIVRTDTWLCSNTSSLSIAGLAAGCQHPERFAGLHFFNPAPIMPLVEIIPALQTDPDLPNALMQHMNTWGKIPVMAKDTPGFIVNRIARPYYSEALRIYEEGIASPGTIDEAMRRLGNFRMGPFELMDFIGHDVNFAVTNAVWQACFYEPRYQPSFTQQRLVDAGWLGRKSGRGFYIYERGKRLDEEAPYDEVVLRSVFERVLSMLINEAADALYYRIADRDAIDLAMTKGVNYPKGLLAWADEWGIAQVVAILDGLYEHYHDPRYKCSPQLRKMAAHFSRFY